MTRHLLNQFPYGPENTTRFPPPVHYDIRDRGFNIARTNPRADPTRPPNRTDVVAHHSVVASAIQDRNSGGAPRRRIPVACGRCRKRKIRCSGDPGDNSGCQNCKQAGITQGTCVFLRVQSELAENFSNHILMKSGFEQVSSSNIDLSPYSSSSSASSSSSSLSLGLHHNHSTPALSSSMQSVRLGNSIGSLGLGGAHAIPVKSVYQDPLGGGETSSNFVLSGTRNAYEGLGDLSNSGSLSAGSDVYSGSFPPYMLPEVGHGLSEASNTNIPNQQEFQRLWTPIPSNNARNSIMAMDQEAQSMGSLPQFLVGSSRTQSAASDGYQIFPALHSLSTSLPDGISSRDKVTTLPPPNRAQSMDSGGRGSCGINTVNQDPLNTVFQTVPLKTIWHSSSWTSHKGAVDLPPQNPVSEAPLSSRLSAYSPASSAQVTSSTATVLNSPVEDLAAMSQKIRSDHHSTLNTSAPGTQKTHKGSRMGSASSSTYTSHERLGSLKTTF